MTRIRKSWLALAGLVVGLAWAPSGADASEIVLLGDSWGVLFGPAVRSKLDAEGHAALGLTNLSIGGTTSAGWSAGHHGDLGLQLGAHPDARIVHVSLGGNDLLGGIGDPLNTLQQAVADTLDVLHQVVAASSASVLITGYDYLPGTLPGLSNTLINFFLDSYVGGLADGVAADASLAAQVTVLNTHGLMQVHFGVPRAGIPAFDPSLPDATLPGPDTAFVDAIHLTAAGYAVYADEVYDRFYAPVLAPEPGAALLLGLPALALLRMRRRAARAATT